MRNRRKLTEQEVDTIACKIFIIVALAMFIAYMFLVQTGNL